MFFSIHSLTFSNIVFEHNCTEILSIDDEGNFNPISITDNAQESPTDNALLFERNSSLVMWLEESGLFVIGNCTSNPQVPDEGLVFENPQGEIATAITSDNNLVTKGNSWELMDAVAYFDGVSVFKKENTGNAITLDHLKIYTPFEVEGIIKKETTGDLHSYYIKDHLGSTRAVIGNQGLEEIIQYHAYGMEEETSSMQPPEKVRERFTGKEYDEDGAVGNAPGLGLVYFGARYYDLEVGIWTKTDPFNQYMYPYAYGGGNPLNGIDPNGMFWYNTEDEETKKWREEFERTGQNSDFWEDYWDITYNPDIYIDKKAWLGSNIYGKEGEECQWMETQLNEMDKYPASWLEGKIDENYLASAKTLGKTAMKNTLIYSKTEEYINYYRNTYLTQFKNEEEVWGLEHYTLETPIFASAHEFGGQQVVKYTSGQQEAIFDRETGKTITDYRNMATFNIGGSKGLAHGKYDVQLWIKYGTHPQDPTTPRERTMKFYFGWISNLFQRD